MGIHNNIGCGHHGRGSRTMYWYYSVGKRKGVPSLQSIRAKTVGVQVSTIVWNSWKDR
jgi:hypothetical protein